MPPISLANTALTLQMLSWIAARPRTYAETMDAWRTSCPRLSIWEDAVEDRMVTVSPVAGAGMSGALVTVTDHGQKTLTNL